MISFKIIIMKHKQELLIIISISLYPELEMLMDIKEAQIPQARKMVDTELSPVEKEKLSNTL